jgi:type I restriction enzyme, S subunit
VNGPWELPEAWCWRRFDEVATVASNLVDPADYPDHPHLAPNHVVPGTGRHEQLATVAEDGVTSKKHLYQPGQIVYSKIRPYLRKATIARTEGLCSADMYPIETELQSRFLMWWMLSGGFTRLALKGRSVIPKINQRELNALPVPVPPPSEQQAIVETIERMLSRLDAALDAVAAGQERLRGIEKAVIQRVLDRVGGHPGTRRVAWREVGSTLSGRAFPSSAYQDDGVPLVRPGNLAPTGRVVWGHSSTRYLPAKFAEEYHKYIIEGRALLMNLTAQSLADDFLGRVCLSSSEDRFLLNQRIAVLSSPVASTDYLYWVFRSPEFRRFVASANTGSLIQHISTKALDDFAFPLPDSQGQRAVVAELEKAASTTHHVGAAVTGVLPRSSVLRRSVLKAAFEGRLVDGAEPGDPVEAQVEAIA